MPPILTKTAPPRRGFAYDADGHHEGFRDATGVVFRPGHGVFVALAFTWCDPPVEGRRPAQLLRTFHLPDLKDGEYLMDAEVGCRGM